MNNNEGVLFFFLVWISHGLSFLEFESIDKNESKTKKFCNRETFTTILSKFIIFSSYKMNRSMSKSPSRSKSPSPKRGRDIKRFQNSRRSPSAEKDYLFLSQVPNSASRVKVASPSKSPVDVESMGKQISSRISDLLEEIQKLKDENKKLKLKLEKCKTKRKFAPGGSGYLEAEKEFYQTAVKYSKSKK
jgi:hypothetical protein